MRLLGGLLLLVGVLLVDRGLHRKAPMFAGCDRFSHHPNGGGV